MSDLALEVLSRTQIGLNIVQQNCPNRLKFLNLLSGERFKFNKKTHMIQFIKMPIKTEKHELKTKTLSSHEK